MKIGRMNKGSWGKVRAFFDVVTEEGFTLKNFKLVEGINGIFVSMPSEKDKEGKYNDTVFADKTLREKLNKTALDQYENQSGPANPTQILAGPANPIDAARLKQSGGMSEVARQQDNEDINNDIPF